MIVVIVQVKGGEKLDVISVDKSEYPPFLTVTVAPIGPCSECTGVPNGAFTKGYCEKCGRSKL